MANERLWVLMTPACQEQKQLNVFLPVSVKSHVFLEEAHHPRHAQVSQKVSESLSLIGLKRVSKAR